MIIARRPVAGGRAQRGALRRSLTAITALPTVARKSLGRVCHSQKQEQDNEKRTKYCTRSAELRLPDETRLAKFCRFVALRGTSQRSDNAEHSENCNLSITTGAPPTCLLNPRFIQNCWDSNRRPKRQFALRMAAAFLFESRRRGGLKASPYPCRCQSTQAHRDPTYISPFPDVFRLDRCRTRNPMHLRHC